MKGLALLGIFMVVYCIFVLAIVAKKPQGIWKMKKIQTFIKVLGEKGTDIAFVVFALIVGGSGIWLLISAQ